MNGMDSWKDRKGLERSWVEAIGGLQEGGPTEAKYPRTKLHTKKCRNITLKTDPLCVSPNQVGCSVCVTSNNAHKTVTTVVHSLSPWEYPLQLREDVTTNTIIRSNKNNTYFRHKILQKTMWVLAVPQNSSMSDTWLWCFRWNLLPQFLSYNFPNVNHFYLQGV